MTSYLTRGLLALALASSCFGAIAQKPVVVTPKAVIGNITGSTGTGGTSGPVETLQTCYATPTTSDRTIVMSTRQWGSFEGPITVYYKVIGGGGGYTWAGGGGGSTAIVKSGTVVAAGPGGAGGSNAAAVSGSFSLAKTDTLRVVIGGGGGGVQYSVNDYGYRYGGGGGAGYYGGGSGPRMVSGAGGTVTASGGGTGTAGGAAGNCTSGCYGAGNVGSQFYGAPIYGYTSTSSATLTTGGPPHTDLVADWYWGSVGNSAGGGGAAGGGGGAGNRGYFSGGSNAGASQFHYATYLYWTGAVLIESCTANTTTMLDDMGINTSYYRAMAHSCGANDYPRPTSGNTFNLAYRAGRIGQTYYGGHAGQAIMMYQAPTCGLIPNYDES